MSAIPAAAVIWVTKALRVQSAAVFATSGAAIGWLCQHLITPWPDTTLWPFVLAGLVTGSTYWFVAVQRNFSAYLRHNRDGLCVKSGWHLQSPEKRGTSAAARHLHWLVGPDAKLQQCVVTKIGR
jgi:hypothetical protein